MVKVGSSYDKEALGLTSGTQIQFNLTGLSQGTVYGIRAAVEDADLFVAGATGTFTTGIPSISTVADSEVDHDSVKITVTVDYPNSNSVNLRYKRTADPVDEDDPDPYQTATAQTTTETDTSQDLVFSLSGLADSTGYTVQASFESDFSGGLVSDTFTTNAPPPAITTVADSEVDHDSAKITVTVSNAGTGTKVYLQYKKRSTTSWPATSTAQQLTATSSSPSPTHTYGGLDASMQYDVRASLKSDFSSGIETDNFTTTAPPVVISDVSVPDADRLHNSAKITVTVSNPNNTTVNLRHKVTTAGDSTYVTATAKTTTTTGASEDVVFTLGSLAANTGYTVQASLDSNFTAGTITPGTFTTRQTPSVSNVSVGTITHGTAKATVSLSNAFNTTVYAHHKVKSADDDTYPDPAPSMTTSASSIDFDLGSLSPGVEYTVQASLTGNFSSGVQSVDFTTRPVSRA